MPIFLYTYLLEMSIPHSDGKHAVKRTRMVVSTPSEKRSHRHFSTFFLFKKVIINKASCIDKISMQWYNAKSDRVVWLV